MAAKDLQAEWRFRKHIPGDMYVDPTHDEFFTTQDVGGLNFALVRETIQNTMDARDPAGSKPALVRFSFRSLPQPERIKPYLAGLAPHLAASENGLVKNPNLGEPVRLLVVEDFGTVGLEGDPQEIHAKADDGKPHNFFFFWRNIGRSDKRESDRGRWGLGKAVFPIVSTARTFFGLTVRKTDAQRYLMGHSLLRTHDLADGETYLPYGHYGIYGHEKYDQFALPVAEHVVLSSFAKLFSVYRGDEPGLSIVVPFLRPEVTAHGVVEAVLSEFFYPILSRELEVWIEDGDDTYEVSSETIESVASVLAEDDTDFELTSYINLLNFSRWVQTDADRSSAIPLGHQELQNAPNWNKIRPDDDDLMAWKNSLDDGKRLHFVVPTKVHRVEQVPEDAQFEVFLERDRELRGAEDHFIRGGLRISGISSLRQRGLRAIVLVDEEPLITMLGDAENPAHTEWQYDARGFRDKYVHAHSCLYFVINSAKNLANFILSAGSETDVTLLEDFFSLPGKENERRKEKAGESGSGGLETVEPDIDVVKTPDPLRVESLNGGFAVRSTDKKHAPRTVTARVAYDIPRGNPLGHFSSEDFDLRKPPIAITHSGIEDPRIRSNQISFLVAQADFRIEIRGFDPQRDLYIDLSWSEDGK